MQATHKRWLSWRSGVCSSTNSSTLREQNRTSWLPSNCPPPLPVAPVGACSVGNANRHLQSQFGEMTGATCSQWLNGERADLAGCRCHCSMESLFARSGSRCMCVQLKGPEINLRNYSFHWHPTLPAEHNKGKRDYYKLYRSPTKDKWGTAPPSSKEIRWHNANVA